MKRKVILNESQLRRVIRESVKAVLKESKRTKYYEELLSNAETPEKYDELMGKFKKNLENDALSASLEHPQATLFSYIDPNKIHLKQSLSSSTYPACGDIFNDDLDYLNNNRFGGSDFSREYTGFEQEL